MSRTLSVAAPVAEQYVGLIAAENIQAGDVVAIGYNDGKAYYLNDPAATDVGGNALRNFALTNKTAPFLYKPAVATAALPVLGTAGFYKTATLSNGNTVIVYGAMSVAAQFPSVNVQSSNAWASLKFVIVDPTGALVVGPTLISNNWVCSAPLNQASNNIYTGGAATGVSLLPLPAGGFVVLWNDVPVSNTVNLLYAVFSNAGTMTTAATKIGTTVTNLWSFGIISSKMAALSNGNFVFIWSMGRTNLFDLNNGSSIAMATSHYYAIYQPNGTPICAQTAIGIGIGDISGVNDQGAVGSWTGNRHFSTALLTFPNGNFSFVGVRTGYGSPTYNLAVRTIVAQTYSSAGVPVVSSYGTAGLSAPAYNINMTGRADYTDAYVLGCTLSNGAGLVFAGGYDGSTNALYSVSQTGVVTQVRSGITGSLTAADIGESAATNIATMQWGYIDLAPYAMVPFGTGALLITNQNEQILASTGATVAIGSALGPTVKPSATAGSMVWAATPFIATTNFGQFLSVQGISNAGALPLVPISAAAFGTPITLPLGVGAQGYVRSISTTANPQGTGANCYQPVIWNAAGYSTTYSAADAAQGLTFVGVAKAAASQGALVSVQTLGQALLRLQFSKPMLIDTRTVLVPQLGTTNGEASAGYGVNVQSNTLGTLATIFGNTATLKGNF